MGPPNAETSQNCQWSAPQATFFWMVLARLRATLGEFSPVFNHFIPSKNDVFEEHIFDVCMNIVAA